MVWKVSLPDGTIIEATASGSCQEAMAKAMMMDIPHGCRVDPFDEHGKKLPNHNAGLLVE